MLRQSRSALSRLMPRMARWTLAGLSGANCWGRFMCNTYHHGSCTNIKYIFYPIGSMYGIYANIGGILMGSMLPYIAAPWILWVLLSIIYNDAGTCCDPAMGTCSWNWLNMQGCTFLDDGMTHTSVPRWAKVASQLWQDGSEGSALLGKR